MISPLLAGLLVLALGKGRPKTVYLTQAPVEVPANTGGRSMDDLHMRRPSIGSARVIPAFPTIATKRPFTKEYLSPPDLPCRLFPGALATPYISNSLNFCLSESILGKLGRPPGRNKAVLKGKSMESVCYDHSSICLLSILVNVAMAFIVMAPFAAARLLLLRMREDAVGKLQPA
jgi:hypothetical protein